MPRAAPAIACRVRPGLGTFIAIEAHAGSQLECEAAIGAAMRCFRRVEAAMHPWRPGSDLAALEAAACGDPVRVDPWTAEVLRLSQQLHGASGGVFDPCLPAEPGRLSDLKVEPEGTLRKSCAMQLDLGGIAKGFAIDRAVEALQAAGCHGGLINAGGDARAFGREAFAIECRLGTRSRRIELHEGALAVSSAGTEGRPSEHQGYYCRRAGDAVLHRRQAAVFAPSAALADALTKCVMLSPEPVSAALLASCGARSLSA
jgi:thiamine biosynthesis lipoprotein